MDKKTKERRIIETHNFTCKFCGKRRRVTYNLDFDKEELKEIARASEDIGWFWIVLAYPWGEEINRFALCPDCKKALEKGTLRKKEEKKT